MKRLPKPPLSFFGAQKTAAWVLRDSGLFLRMKTSEDYIFCERAGNTSWRFPISKKHVYACAVTMTAAAVLAVFSPHEDLATVQNSQQEEEFDESSDIQDSEEQNLIANNSAAVNQSLSDLFASKPQSSSQEATDNYDDTLPDSALADSDDVLDDQVKDLAARDNGNKAEDELKWFEEDVQKGDTISSIFSDLNIPASVTMAILDNKKVAAEVNSLQLGEHLSFLLDDKSRLMAFVKPLDKDRQLRFYRDTPDKADFAYVIEKKGSHLKDGEILVAENPVKPAASQEKDQKIDQKISNEPKAEKKLSARESRGRLVVVSIGKGETFSTAANNAGISYAEINKILNLFKGRIQFSRNIRAGDTMRVLFTDSKGRGKISAVEFSLQGRKVSAFLNSKDGKYYDEHGLNSTVSNAFRRFPFNIRAKVTSPFNPSRRHPVTGVIRPHNGVDFGMPVGTPVIAPSDGVVTKASFTRSTGYYIVLRHRGAYSTVYMHLSKLGVKVGQSVKMGSVIARSGNTGLSTGPHLHYELRINGRPVNALRVKLSGMQDPGASSDRKRFAANIKNYKRDLYNQKLIAKR